MYRIMFQVISVVNGIWHHEGFFAGKGQAINVKNWVEKRMKENGEHGEVFVIGIKL